MQDIAVQIKAEAEAAARKLDRESVFTAASFARMESRASGRQEWNVEGLIKARSLNLLAGDSHLGKSPLAIQLGLCKAAGVPFLGYPSGRAGRVVYCDFENDGTDFWRTARTISRFLGLKEVPETFFGWSPYWDDRRSATTVARPLDQEVKRIVDVVRPNLVVVDPLRVVKPRAMEQVEALTELVGMLRRLARDHGCAFILIHHLRKEDRQAAGGRPSLQDSGSRWFQEVCGQLGLVNHVDGRYGVDEPRDAAADLIFGGYRRGTPSLSPHFIERVHDKNGDPQGYRLVTGIDHIQQDWRDVFHKLGTPFRYTDVKKSLGNDDRTTRFLGAFRQAGAVEKLSGKEGYRKVHPGPAQDDQSDQSNGESH